MVIIDKGEIKQKKNIELVDSLEKISCAIFTDAEKGAKHAALEIASQIRCKQESGEKCVLGLATGSTPGILYNELIRLHNEDGLSFKNVVSFNLDEYYPIDAAAFQSYHNFMHRVLFNHIDIEPSNIYILNGSLPKEDINKHCAEYEQLIASEGGIDIQVLGIGINGHIGFNEPGSSIHSKTRLITLENSTRLANAYEFGNISEVPRLAITMGISTILKSRKIILMAWGSDKAGIIKKAVEGFVSEQIPASLLQHHNNCTVIIDAAAATELTRNKLPWLTGECEWNPAMIKKAVVHLALHSGKPILSLTAKDYNEYGLGDLIVDKGDASEINLQVYYMLRDCITGWPAGKPNGSNTAHPERATPFPKTVIIFSPHPDDDIISMGGTFHRLHEQGNNVHVAYQTSGNIAVTDEFINRFLDFAAGFGKIAGMDTRLSEEMIFDIRKYLSSREKNQVDTDLIKEIKALIRRCEAKATCRYVGINEDNVHFQNLPFYETGTIEKAPLGAGDIAITAALLQKIKPQQIFCAGDLADPHGTHKICLDVVLAAINQIIQSGDQWIKNCWLWLYKGAWQEWNINEIEMAIPMSPDQVLKKRHGIFIHQSQKDIIPFKGNDHREFWQRAEERNKNTADQFAQLGLTQYEAMEAFVRYKFES